MKALGLSATQSGRWRKGFVVRFLTHPIVIALVLGFVAFLLVDVQPGKYRFELIRTEKQKADPYLNQTYYADLNDDGRTERIVFANSNPENCYAIVFLDNNQVLDQWNFMGNMTYSSAGYFLGDYDHDNFKELVSFSVLDHRVLMNVVEPYPAKKHLVVDLMIDTIPVGKKDGYLVVPSVKFLDINDDGMDELVISIITYDAYQPRKSYIYDMVNVKLVSSPHAGTALNELFWADLDGDGELEFLAQNNSSNNYPDGNIFLPDTVSWLVILDEDLQFEKVPKPSGTLFGATTPLILEGKDSTKAWYFTFFYQNEMAVCQWYEVGSNLSLDTVPSPVPDPKFIAEKVHFSADRKNKILLNENWNKMCRIEGFEFEPPVRFGRSMIPVPIYNGEGGPDDLQYAFQYERNSDFVVFYDSDLKKIAGFKVPPSGAEYDICWAGVNDNIWTMQLMEESNHTYLSVRLNPWRNLGFLVFMALSTGFYLFILAIQAIQKSRLQAKEVMRREILELQLKSVRNQLDPHFTFNALNTLSGLSLTGDSEGVNHFIDHFSRLLRTQLQSANQVMVSLQSELNFIRDFFELQRIRFDHEIHLEIELGTNTDLNRMIPKMMILNHVENAIKHGLRPKLQLNRREGRAGDLASVWVRIRELSGKLIITIEDNGVGRENCMIPESEKMHKGLESEDQIIRSVRQLYNLSVARHYEDLADANGNPAGTRVILEIS